MAEAKPWDATFARVRAIRAPGFVYGPTSQITSAALDEAEQALAIRFPASYREFMLRFGFGAIEGGAILRPPTATALDKVTRDYSNFLEDLAEEFAIDTAWMRRLVLVASDGLCDAYGWHPAEVTSYAPHECRFYHIQRAPRHPPRVVGNTFAEFLAWAKTEAIAGSQEPIEPTNSIRLYPRAIRYRSKPKHSDVQRWLLFNNRTARLIAKSIRDDGRADAFPVLADALQDAGCTHADLLDACRTGDPDIDGVWVLQVLLGAG